MFAIFSDLVSYITENFILPVLKEENYDFDVSYTGSNYEYTTVPGKSDYDIQLLLRPTTTKQNKEIIYSAEVQECGDPAWRLVKGGPPEFLDSNGYLSTEKVSKLEI